MIKYRNLIIVIALIAVIGTGLYMRSHYVRADGKYILAFDPYYHYRMAETILEEGSRPEWDTIAAYPTGSPVRHPPLFHYYLAYTYKILSIFSGMTLFEWCIYANIIPFILAIIAAFLTGKALTNELGGLFTALFAAVNGAISSRTVIGYTDTDIFIVLFSFAAMYFLISALKSKSATSERNRDVWSILLGFSLFLFALTWVGYWHLLLLVFSVFIIFFIKDAVKRKLDRDLLSVFFLSFLSFTLPWTLYRGYYLGGVILLVMGVLWYFREKIHVPHIDKWGNPLICAVLFGFVLLVLNNENVFSMIFRNVGNLSGFISSEESLFVPDISISILQRGEVTLPALSRLFSTLMLLAPLGVIVLIWKRTRISLQMLVYLSLYFLGTGILMLQGGRYTLLFAVPLIVAAGAFFGLLPEVLEGKVTSKGVCAVILICSLSVIPCYTEGAKVSRATSAMSDDMWEALTWIDESTPQDAVVICGWDMGYYVEAIARRRSVMNGSHYDIRWRVVKYGKVVETTDEEVAVKEIYGFSDRSEVEALRNFPENSDDIILQEMGGFAEDNAYVLVSEWTMLTFYWLSYFGNWDYTTGKGEGRVYNLMWAQDARKLISATEYIYGDSSVSFSVTKENENFHTFILDESGYIPIMGTLFFKGGDMYFFQKEGGEVGVMYVPPQNIPYLGVESRWPDVPSQVFLIKEADLECMLTRLYFFNGEGLHYFELVKDCGTAKVFRVHKVRQEFDQGVITQEDTYKPT